MITSERVARISDDDGVSGKPPSTTEGLVVTRPSGTRRIRGSFRRPAESEARGPLLHRVFSSTRTRMIAAYIVLLALSTVASVLFVRQVLLVRLNEEINNQFAQEVREFRTLIQGNDPRTGRPFGSDLKSIFDIYFSRNIPDEGEALWSFVGDELYKSKRSHDAGHPLDEIPGATDRWTAVKETERGEFTTTAGEFRYLAVPVRFEGRVMGAFVVTNFPAGEQSEVEEAVRVAAGVTVVVLIVASLVAWIVTSRILAPLRNLTGTVESITQSDLTRRLPTRGPAEVAQLATRFNQMLDRLEEAFGIVRQFADDAGHELRTPITIIRGHLEVLGRDPGELNETRALVTDELDRMSRMVDDLLVLAKAQEPDFLSLEAIDIDALTAELLTKASALAPRSWLVESAGRGLLVADRQRLTQAVMQLAQNATQHTSAGDPIALGSAVANGEARLWVRDGGPGIPTEEQERIFDRFSRGAAGRGRSEGAGLGLAIVKTIAEAHHGRVELRSRPGHGATFALVIPIDQPLDDEPVDVLVEEPLR